MLYKLLPKDLIQNMYIFQFLYQSQEVLNNKLSIYELAPSSDQSQSAHNFHKKTVTILNVPGETYSAEPTKVLGLCPFSSVDKSLAVAKSHNFK